MKKITLYFLFCIVLIYVQNTNAQDFNKRDLEVKIDSLIPNIVNDTTPGLVIGIVQKGELIFSKGYGLANISYGISNDSEMVYNIGSVSKQFLGYAFAMLQVESRLNIDDPVSKFLDDWPDFKHTVTLKHLLTHTSGYREAYTMSTLAGRPVGVDRLSKEECLEVVRQQPGLEFTPGSRWTYNSTAWVILAEVLEKVTGEPADKWVENNILKPLQMNNTQIESYVGEVITNSAESYTYNEKLGYTNEESNRAIFGGAEVYTSITDLVHWINNYRTFEIGGKAVNDLFLDPFILSDGTNSKYALGIGNSSYRGLKRYRHTGSHEAFATQLSYFPEHDLGILTISNFGRNGWLETSKIADILLEEYMTSTKAEEISEFKIVKEKLEQFAGLYLASNLNSTIDLTIKEDTLYSRGEKLVPSSENTFHINGWDGHLLVEKLDNGTIQLTEVGRLNKTYTKVKEWVPGKEDLVRYKGDYWSNELETIYHVEVEDEKLKMNHRWLGNFTLEPITQDFFKTDWGYIIKFIRNEKDKITGLSFYSSRTSNVIFQRK